MCPVHDAGSLLFGSASNRWRGSGTVSRLNAFASATAKAASTQPPSALPATSGTGRSSRKNSPGQRPAGKVQCTSRVDDPTYLLLWAVTWPALGSEVAQL